MRVEKNETGYWDRFAGGAGFGHACRLRRQGKGQGRAGRLLTAAQARAESQKLTYENYAPAEISKLDGAVIKQSGLYVFYVVSGDPARTEAYLDKVF